MESDTEGRYVDARTSDSYANGQNAVRPGCAQYSPKAENVSACD